ncbi:MAG TPA: ATP-binding protein [Chthonomonadaceae bacterium]|nr:ATP-binding protein [Chthonomonadaceae bacterium]
MEAALALASTARSSDPSRAAEQTAANDDSLARRTEELFAEHRQSIYIRTDRIFAGLMVFQWIAGIVAALVISPRTWTGPVSQTHIHVWVALVLGGIITAFPVALILARPGHGLTRHVVAAGQVFMSALLIHLSGGRIETHFHVFGSLAILAFYRDWRVLVTATVIVAADHLVRGIYAPQSVYGVAAANGWRWLEHAGWVLFEDTFLVISCLQSLKEMHGIAERQAAMEQAKAAAEQANEAKSAFLSRMSHELRTPLNGILGFGQILEMEDLSARDQESVDQILKAGRHLLGLINEVLDISRVESGSLSVSLEPTSVREVLDEAVGLVQPMALQNRVRVEVGSAGAPYVTADRQRLKQVLLNLLSNAVKYNREGGSVTVCYGASGDHHLAIHVADTGVGIPKQLLARLFTPFDRLGAERTGVEGTGLGLAVSKALVSAMHGTIAADSRDGVGTTFTVELEQADDPSMRVAPQEIEEPDEYVPEPSGERRVLYIEDNLANLKLVESILERRPNVRLVSAMQGGLGLEMARTYRPHLALLDLNLPDISGRDVLRRLQEDPATRRIPVVMITADASPGQEQRLLDEGASAYLTKPIEIKRFLSVLDQALSAA